MSPLLDALVAAQKTGFDAPKCGTCAGAGTTALGAFGDATCAACKGEWCAACSPAGDWCECDHYGRHRGYECPDVGDGPCKHCEGTGLDASDPFGLIGRAMVWLWDHGYDAWDGSMDHDNPEAGRALKLVLESGKEPHDCTTPGRATALLRLVARVGS